MCNNWQISQSAELISEEREKKSTLFSQLVCAFVTRARVCVCVPCIVFPWFIVCAELSLSISFTQLRHFNIKYILVCSNVHGAWGIVYTYLRPLSSSLSLSLSLSLFLSVDLWVCNHRHNSMMAAGTLSQCGKKMKEF